jgi:primosomal protein N' (replication factor Y)
MCAIGDVYGAMPSGLLLESEIISQKTDVFVDESKLSDDEYLIYQALQQQSSLKIQDIVSILNKKNISSHQKTDRQENISSFKKKC